MLPDDYLVQKILDGDDDAFTLIVEKYQKYVWAITYNITRDYQEAENLAQDTFIQVYRSLPQYNFRGLKKWMGRIAVNKAIDWKRKSEKERKQQFVCLEEILSLKGQDTDPVEEQVIRTEEIGTVISLCNELPQKYADVINKYFFEAKNCGEIAREEDISVKTVETRLYRAKKMLMQKMEGGWTR